MKIFTKLLLAAAIPLAALPVSAKITSPINRDINRYAFKASTRSNILNGKRSERIDQINKMMETGAARFNVKTRASELVNPNPTVSQGPVSTFGTIDGPDGKLWFYSAEFDTRVIPHHTANEDWDELVHKAYTFKIYDENMKLVGQITDKVRYNENEVRTPSLDLVPVMTKHFFNDDDNYEIIVGITFNTTTAGFNTNRTYVYSINGEKETLDVDDVTKPEVTFVSKVCDKPVYVLDETIGDVLDASHDGKEVFYITTYGESLPQDYDYDENMTLDEMQKRFWEDLCKSNINFQLYAKAGADGKLQPVGDRIAIPILAMPGNQDTSPFLMSFTHDNQPYFMVSRYKEIFWNPYFSVTDDLSMRESNSLVIDIYKLDGANATLDQHTEIPFTKDANMLANYYSVGDLRYRSDINYGNFSKDGKAAFYITKTNMDKAESEEYNYYVYNASGAKIRTIAEDCDSNLEMYPLPGHEPQQMFIQLLGTEYYLTFVDLISCKEVSSFSYRIDMGEDSDPETILNSLDRVASGDKYMYVAEMRNPTIGDNDEDIMRFAWLNMDGTLHHIDEVVMGTSIHYAKSFISGAVLNPTLFDNDPDDYEYIVLCKQGLPDGTTTENLIVAKARSVKYPDGHTYLTVGTDSRGALQNIMLYPEEVNPMLMLTHYDVGTMKYHLDYWFLPFSASSVEDIEAGATVSGISFDGSYVTAQGQDIKVYSIQGVLHAEGNDSVNVSDLASGIYVAVAGNKAVKFVIR